MAAPIYHECIPRQPRGSTGTIPWEDRIIKNVKKCWECAFWNGAWNDLVNTHDFHGKNSTKMAKYKSILQLKGAIGDVVYYTLNGKQVARRKAKGVGERIKTSENHAITRTNNSQFTAANHMASGLYRMAKLAGYPLDPAQQRKLVQMAKLFIQRNKEIDFFKPAHYSRMFSGVKLHKNFKPALMAVNRYTHGTFVSRLTTEKVRLTMIFGQYYPVMKYEDQYSTQLDMEKVATVEIDFDATDNADELIPFDSLLPEMDFDWDVCVMATAPFDSEGRVWETKAGVWVV